MLVATLHIFAHLSSNSSSFLLTGLRTLINVALTSVHVPSDRINAILHSIPTTVRGVTSHIALDPVTKAFVCCPRCYHLYELGDDDQLPSYPEHCSHRATADSDVCGRRLRKRLGSAESWAPTREYLTHSFRHWLAHLYTRPGMDRLLGRDPRSMSLNDGVLRDIWDGEVLRDFEGPVKGKHFLDGDGEDRLVFGINQDGFNPFGNRTAGKMVSVGPIYLVCFNLPPDLRYRPENVFLAGVIPGPGEPSKEQMNELLQPLVSDLLTSWKDGFSYDRTPSSPNGRRVRCALVPIIADLPAARRLAGIGSYSSNHWCSECEQTLQDRNNVDSSSFTPRDRKTHIEHAKEWRDAGIKAREELYDEHHIRWSTLLDLPYWDPTRFITIDSMHGFYLGLFHHHIRAIWGMDVSLQEGQEQCSFLSSAAPRPDEVIRTLQSVAAGNIEATCRVVKASVLQHICRERGLRYKGTKRTLVQNLINSVRSLCLFYVLPFINENQLQTSDMTSINDTAGTPHHDHDTTPAVHLSSLLDVCGS